MKKKYSKEIAKTEAQVFFDEIGFVLDDDQYRDALSMLDLFHFYTRTHMVSLIGTRKTSFGSFSCKRNVDRSVRYSITDSDRQKLNSPNLQLDRGGGLPRKRSSAKFTNVTASGPGNTLRSVEITENNTWTCTSRRCLGTPLLGPRSVLAVYWDNTVVFDRVCLLST
jgi:hypothetical protein